MPQPSLNDSLLKMREMSLADLGEMAGPVTHEVNNLLNTLTLHLAVWQQSTPQALAPDLDVIRQKVKHVAQVLQLFQQRRMPVGIEPVLVDLTTAIQHTVDEIQSTTPGLIIQLQMQTGPLSVRGYEADVRRLLRYLLTNLVRSATAK